MPAPPNLPKRPKVVVPPEATCPRCKKSNREAECACYSSGEFWELQRKLRAAEAEIETLKDECAIQALALAAMSYKRPENP